jgi:magnesium-transporting ATPase (P-type)
LKRLHSLNVDVKVLTGDNEIITAYICKEVGMPVEHLLLGSQIETMSETELFGNIVKYIKMAASSNFGNMFSVVGASAFLPFLPMLPGYAILTQVVKTWFIHRFGE